MQTIFLKRKALKGLIWPMEKGKKAWNVLKESSYSQQNAEKYRIKSTPPVDQEKGQKNTE